MLPVWTEVISEKETKGQCEANSKHKHEITNLLLLKKNFLYQQNLIPDGKKNSQEPAAQEGLVTLNLLHFQMSSL